MAESGPSPILMLLALKWKWVMPGHWIKGGDFENIYIYIYIYIKVICLKDNYFISIFLKFGYFLK